MLKINEELYLGNSYLFNRCFVLLGNDFCCTLQCKKKFPVRYSNVYLFLLNFKSGQT